MDYGSKFKVIRLERGKTQQDIADYIGKSNMLISGIETGKNKVFSDDDFLKISEYLSLTEEEKKELYKLAIISNSKLPKLYVFF
jgi:transcriptional regulator with XRE-family HTH domain